MSRLVIALCGVSASSFCSTLCCGAVFLVPLTAPTHVETGAGCAQSCDAIADNGCDLQCDVKTGQLTEFASSQLAYSPLTVELSATAEVQVLSRGGFANAGADAEFTFTIDAPTAYYASWSVFFPPADNNFLPASIPERGSYIGTLEPGTYFVKANLDLAQRGMGSQTKISGLFVRLIPDLNADCDEDGTPDWQEIINGTQFDANSNGLPDECEPSPDLNGDGHINLIDVSILLGAWGTSGPGDLNLDGIVNEIDLAIAIGAWIP